MSSGAHRAQENSPTIAPMMETYVKILVCQCNFPQNLSVDMLPQVGDAPLPRTKVVHDKRLKPVGDSELSAEFAAASPTTSQRPRRTLPRRLLRLAIVAFTTYVVLAILHFVFQRHLIYFPTREHEATPRDLGMDFEDVWFPAADGVRLSGWFMPRSDAVATVMFAHGNAGNISHRVYTAKALHEQKLNVFLFDYRGYGQSAGKPSETGLYADAEGAWAYLTQTRGIPPEKTIIAGESLGGAVAIELATRHAPAGLVVESTFTSLVDVAGYHYPYFPVSWLLSDRYNSIDKIAAVKCPVLILHGSADELVPIGMGRALFAAAGEPKQFIETPGNHNEAGLTYSPMYAGMAGEFIRVAANARP